MKIEFFINYYYLLGRLKYVSKQKKKVKVLGLIKEIPETIYESIQRSPIHYLVHTKIWEFSIHKWKIYLAVIAKISV